VEENVDRAFSEIHKSVLEEEILAYLKPTAGHLYIDGTLGLGGHTRKILEKSGPDGKVIAFEWDSQAAIIAQRRLKDFGERIKIIPKNYSNLLECLKNEQISHVDGLILDLGVSSLQLDKGERGFSFNQDAPLDMRMDQSRQRTAAELVRRLSKDELADIFYNYGEEIQSRRIAAKIVESRKKEEIRTTRQLASIVSAAIPKKYHPKKIHAATKVFQALRIAVNNELDNLVKLLNEAPMILKQEARICVISFHSLEDRIVKQMFTNNPDYSLVSRRPIQASEREIFKNPRARSAKLRIAARV